MKILLNLVLFASLLFWFPYADAIFGFGKKYDENLSCQNLKTYIKNSMGRGHSSQYAYEATATKCYLKKAQSPLLRGTKFGRCVNGIKGKPNENNVTLASKKTRRKFAHHLSKCMDKLNNCAEFRSLEQCLD